MELSELVLPCRLDGMTGMVALTDATPSSPTGGMEAMSDLDVVSGIARMSGKRALRSDRRQNCTEQQLRGRGDRTARMRTEGSTPEEQKDPSNFLADSSLL